MKKCLPIVLSLLISSCSHSRPDKNNDIDSEIGWMHGNCLAIKQDEINLPRALTLIRFDEDNVLDRGSITRKARSGEECYPLMENRKSVNMAEGYSFYIVESKNKINLAVGVLDPEKSKELNFKYCSTSEGIRFSASKGNSTVWEAYYYLGYESEATCDDESKK